MLVREKLVDDGMGFATELILVLNFVFSVGVIFSNKFLYKYYHVPAMSLASAHFSATFIGLCTYSFFGGFKMKRLPLAEIAPISLAFCGSVVFTNLSLKYNTVGTYQILKCLGDPMLLILQSLLFKKSHSNGVKFTLGIMALGIILNSIFDMNFNPTGIFYAGIAVISSTLYIMWVDSKQHDLDATPLELLLYQSPISSVLLNVIIYASGGTSYKDLYQQCSKEDTSMIIIMLSLAMACGVNITVYYIIRRTSVVTYAVFSKLKTCTIVLVGSVLFTTEHLKPLQIIGILITIVGTAVYSTIKIHERRSQQQAKVDRTIIIPNGHKTTLSY